MTDQEFEQAARDAAVKYSNGMRLVEHDFNAGAMWARAEMQEQVKFWREKEREANARRFGMRLKRLAPRWMGVRE